MKINKLELKNYRNIENAEIIPCEGVNVIYGENAQGKTNILESIFLFTGLKSFRSSKDSELVSFNKEKAVINIKFDTFTRTNTAQITVTDRRRINLNGVNLNSPTAVMSKFQAALFSPSFMSIIQNGPSERRRFIDSAICQIKPSYAVMLSEYTKLLKQRNAVLKNDSYSGNKKMFLECIDENFSRLGEDIYNEREEYLKKLTPFAESIYEGLSSGKEKLGFSYIRKGDKTGEMSFSEILSSHIQTDIAAGLTLTGIHRDDIDIKINGISAKSFGSQGQKRSAAVAMKLSEAQVMKEYTGEEPVILLDDVMSELDTARQDYILNHIKNRQVFITCCEPNSVLRMSEGKTFNIVNGKVRENSYVSSSGT